MNHIFKVIWNQTLACWQAVTETASSHSKSKSTASKLHTLSNISLTGKPTNFAFKTLALTVAMAFSVTAIAEPTGGQVTAGAGVINQTGAITTINQQTQNMAIDWHSFNVRANEAVNFNQPNASSIALNRVTGTESSSIMGSLTANGKVYILNPNGILFGAGAQVNVGGLVASTLNLSNANFMAGNFNFTGNGTGSIINQGNINIANGGTLAFIAPVIKNAGTIVADQGNVMLAAADDVTLTLQDGNLVSYTLNKGSVQTLIDNGGLIQADSGHVVLTSKGLDALSKSVINHTGIIEAQTVSSKDGKIELLGDMKIGELNVAGKLDASAPTNGDGGFVETSAAKVSIAANTQVNTASAIGSAGTWLIDPLDITINSSIATAINSALKNGNVTISTAGNNTPSTVSGETNGNGDIFVNNALTWSTDNLLTLNADRNIQINASISGEGASSGLALNTSTGEYYLNNGAKINLAGNATTFSADGVNYTIIHDVNQLQSMNNNLSGNYVLGDNIDASATSGWNSGAGFNPITLNGSFNGLNHTIVGLAINRPSQDFVGLFSTLSGSVRNLSLLNVNIIGHDYVGGLLAYSGQQVSNEYGLGTNASFIQNVNVSGYVIGNDYVGGVVAQGNGIDILNVNSTVDVNGRDAVGGVIGYLYPSSIGVYGTFDSASLQESTHSGFVNGRDAVGGLAGSIVMSGIAKSYSNSNVTGNNAVGGLSGAINQGIVSESYSVGDISGNNQVGGLAGTLGSYSTLSNVYSSANVTGNNDVGGLAGTGAASSISNSYASGQVNGNSQVGGLAGSDQLFCGPGYCASSTVVSNFWDSQTSSQITSPYGTGKTTAEMQQQATYTGWDFVNTWRIVEGSSYPLLRALTQGTIVVNPTSLDIAAPQVSKVYDGVAVNSVADLSQLTGWNGGALANGLLGNDSLTDTSIFSGTLSYDGANSNWQGAKNAGNYIIEPTGLSSQKYEIIYTNGSLNITPKPIGVTGTRVYDGTVNAYFGDNTSLHGVLSADLYNVYLASGVGQLSGKDVVINPFAVGLVDNVGTQPLASTNNLTLSGTSSSNYVLTTDGSAWKVTPRPLILQALDTDRYYGKPNPEGTSVISVSINNGQSSGLVLDERIDNIDFSYANTAMLNAPVYSQHDINISNAHFAVGNSTNYAIQYLPAKLTIVPDAPDAFKNFEYWKNSGLSDSEYSRLLGYSQVLTDQIKRELIMATDVYKDTVVELSKNDLIQLGNSGMLSSGLYAQVYRENLDPNRIYIAFRGTEFTKGNDLLADINQAFFELPGQYTDALAFTQGVLSQNPNANISVIGHSLGGGIAMYVAGMTGVNATTFNAAKLKDENFNSLKNNPQYSAVQKVENYIFDNEIVQNFADTYYGNVRLINVGSEGQLDDHRIGHINKDFDAVAANAISRLQRDYTSLTGAGSTTQDAITALQSDAQLATNGVSVIFTNPNDGMSNFINTNEVLMSNSPYSTLLEYYVKREFGGDALQAYKDRQAIVDAEYSVNAADVFPDSFFNQNLYRIAQGFQASSHWLLGFTDTVQTAVSAIDPQTYAVISAKAVFVGAVLENFKNELDSTEINEITELIEASIDATGALRALQGHADDAIKAEMKLNTLKSKSSFNKYRNILSNAKNEIALEGLGAFSDLVGPIVDAVLVKI